MPLSRVTTDEKNSSLATTSTKSSTWVDSAVDDVRGKQLDVLTLGMEPGIFQYIASTNLVRVPKEKGASLRVLQKMDIVKIDEIRMDFGKGGHKWQL